MFNRKIISLEEDFKTLGIPLPAGTTVPAKVEESTTTPEATPAPVAETKEVEEAKQVRVKRHTSAERRKWKMAKKKGGAKAKSKKYRNKASVKKMLKKHRMKASKLRHGKAAGRKRMVFTGLDQVSNILENVQKVLAEINSPKDNFAKAFESVASLSQRMADSISKVGLVEGLEDEDKKYLTKTASEYAEISESAAEIVAALNSDGDIDFEDLEENFALYLRALQEGLDLVADVLEDDSLTEAVNALELEEGCEDDEDEDEEDEEEEDDEDEGNS